MSQSRTRNGDPVHPRVRRVRRHGLSALENKLRIAEQRLESVIADAPRAIVTLAGDGAITSSNPRAVLTFGWSVEEALGKRLGQLILPTEVHAAHAAAIEDLLTTGGGSLVGRRIEITGWRRNGERFPIEFTIGANRADEGWHVTVALYDISERQAKVELFGNAFNHASIGMALVGLDGRFLKLNDAFCGIIGYSRTEACELDFQTITHPDDLNDDLALLTRLLAGEIESYNFDKRYLRKGGRPVSVRLSVSLVEDLKGSPKHFVARVQDLTNERCAEDAYRLMAENATDIIMTCDLDGIVTFVSPACEAVTGYPADAILGRRATAFMHDDDVAFVQGNFQALVTGMVAPRGRCRVKHRDDGRIVWLESNAAPMRDGPGGAATGVIDVIRDVTAQKDGEDALAAAQAAADRAMRSKADFLANMSHELRTPLNSIIGFSRLLNDTETLDPQSRRYIGLLHRAGQALGAVIENVLDYSKLEAAALSLDHAPFDLPAFVTETVDMMGPQADRTDGRHGGRRQHAGRRGDVLVRTRAADRRPADRTGTRRARRGGVPRQARAGADDVDLNRDLMLAILSRYRCKVDVASDGAEAVARVAEGHYDLVLMDCQMR